MLPGFHVAHMTENPIIPTSDPRYSGFNQDLNFNLGPTGKSPLHHAVIKRDIVEVHTLLHAGEPVNVKDYAANDPLHYAATTTDPTIFDLLVRFGADINAKGLFNRSPLHLAVLATSRPVVDALVTAGAQISSQDQNGNTPLHLALKRPSYTAQVRELVKALLRARANVNMMNAVGLTPFHKSLQMHRTSTEADEEYTMKNILDFLENGANVSKPLPDGYLPLTIFLDKLHRQWSDTRLKHSSEKTLSVYTMIVCRFLDMGASPTTVMSDGEPLVSFYFRKIYHSCHSDEELEQRFCNLVEPSYVAMNGNTLLHQVLSEEDSRSASLTESLLRNGVDPNHQNHIGQTPMHLFWALRGRLAVPGGSCRKAPGGQGRSLDLGQHWQMRTVRGFEEVFEIRHRPVAVALRADLQQAEDDELLLEVAAPTPRSKIWPQWDRAIKMVDLFQARDQIFRRPSSLPEDVGAALEVNAYAVLAEKFLDRARIKFAMKFGGGQEHCLYIARVLHDCRARNISLDMKYYDDLIKLCLPPFALPAEILRSDSPRGWQRRKYPEGSTVALEPYSPNQAPYLA